MSIAKVHTAHAHSHVGARRNTADGEHHKSLKNAEPGQEVSLRILNKIGDQRFVASMGDSRYVVDSAVRLAVGETVKATVSAVGGIVELKYLGSGQFEKIDSAASNEQPGTDTPGGAALAGLQSKYRISLPQQVQQLVTEISNRVQRPETMAMGALYLSRIGESMQPEALQALYAKQIWGDDKIQSGGGAADLSVLIRGVQQGNAADLEALAKLLGDAVDQAGSTSVATADGGLGNAVAMTGGDLTKLINQDTHSKHDESDDSLRDLAHRLLNLHDAGTLAYHYGSLPVIVADQLVELDLVLFRERESATRPQGLRKLVMTLRTETLGKVEIVAQSLDTQLTVSIAAQSTDSSDSLATHAQEVRDLLGRLGWNIGGVSYRLTTETGRAAEQIVKHVVSAGSLDAVV
jgi:GGDEF domain-containing protein